ncbi:FAD-linked oxidoreductase afoF [Trichoderma ghanense]|uniref:FAD-linked oxidoreductase afoF n=1 Tax=Trichoderma ghanense TaxID=65468 RepID=A0ABY2H8W5_9HYPO
MSGKVVSREEWLTARRALLEKEKDLTHKGDALAAQRRSLPMVKIDKPYLFQGPDNATLSLDDLFDGQAQLIVYHFMFDPDSDAGCPGCTHMGESLPDVRHLRSKDTNLVAISRAPIAKIEAYKQRAGWEFPWYSSGASDFNYDFHATLDEGRAPKEYNFAELSEDDARFKPDFEGDVPGFSVFLKQDGEIFHTYSTFMRGDLTYISCQPKFHRPATSDAPLKAHQPPHLGQPLTPNPHKPNNPPQTKANMTTSPFKDTNLLTFPHTIPDPNASAPALLSRWSDTLVDSPPALIAVPNTEQDVVSAIAFARSNNLVVLPTAGRHGSAVPITPRTLYLDLKNFNAIRLDNLKDQVVVGGGVLTGDLIRHLAEEGYFTSVVNSNAVGVVGGLLGGGNTSVNGLVGWMADSAVSVRVVTAAGDVLDVGSSSTGEQRALFNALCGAGHGLCVVVGATMRVYPLSSLGLSPASSQDPTPSIWSRTVVLPPDAIDSVLNTFLAFIPPPEPMNMLLAFSRGPPGTPMAGKPILALTTTYYGPAKEAEASPAGASLRRPSLASRALKTDTIQIPFPRLNAFTEPLNAHGGLKTMFAARIARLSPQALKDAYARYVAETDRFPDASRSALMFHSSNPRKSTELGATPEHAGKFLEARNRGISALGVLWCQEPATQEALAAFYSETLASLQKADEEDGLPPRTFPGAMKFLPGRRDLLSEERLAELDRLHTKWNGDGLFWNPYKA